MATIKKREAASPAAGDAEQGAIDGAQEADVSQEPQIEPLHTVVAKASANASKQGDFRTNAALHRLENALGAVRHCLRDVERELGPEHADLIDRIKTTI